jgi:hypothetical protein
MAAPASRLAAPAPLPESPGGCASTFAPTREVSAITESRLVRTIADSKIVFDHCANYMTMQVAIE